MKPSLCITFVRHGETTLNVKGIIQGHTDAPLSENGISQGEALGKHISHEKYTRAYSSDLIRARHTAELILKHSKFPVSVATDKRLRERSYGAAEGKYFALYYEDAKRLGVRSEDYIPAGAESVPQVSARIQQFFAELCDLADTQDKENPENILVVTHGGLLKVFMTYLDSCGENFVLENFEKCRAFKLSPNTGVTRIRVHPLDNNNDEGKQRTIRFVSLHDASHLKRD
jgi:broad specificity phosphatase PhoE